MLAIATSGSGCAFGARHVDLTYAPGLPAGSTGEPGELRVAVVRLDDSRRADEGVGSLLGKVRNGYGMPTASVLANQDPVLWVTEGVARALVAQKVGVARVGSRQDAGDLPVVTGHVTRASGGMYMSMDANVSADLTVERAGEPIGSLSCRGRVTRVAWTASASEYRAVFQAAMTEFANDCGPRLVRLLRGDPSR